MAALQHFKLIEDAILARLDAGFNAAMAQAAGIFGAPAFELDFSESSGSVVLGYVDEQAVEMSSLVTLPGMAIYTDSSDNRYAEGTMGVRFDGAVMAAVDLFFLPRDGREGTRPDVQMNMAAGVIEDLIRTSTWWPQTSAISAWPTRVASQKARRIPYADGYLQKLSMQIQFKVIIP